MGGLRSSNYLYGKLGRATLSTPVLDAMRLNLFKPQTVKIELEVNVRNE